MAELARPSRSSGVPATVEVRRSTRRRRTVSAYRDGDTIVVLVPARLRKADEQRLVSDLVERITRREASQARSGARRGDAALVGRARELSTQYLDGRPQPSSVRWVRNMATRWGSCTMADRTIRLSHRLQPMPSWVIDYVLVHELAHWAIGSSGPTSRTKPTSSGDRGRCRLCGAGGRCGVRLAAEGQFRGRASRPKAPGIIRSHRGSSLLSSTLVRC